MSISVEGLYRNGKVELLAPVAEAEGSRVTVTWMRSDEAVSLRARGLDEANAADLRRRLATFAADWDRPEMSVYDELSKGEVVLVLSRTRTSYRYSSFAILRRACAVGQPLAELGKPVKREESPVFIGRHAG